MHTPSAVLLREHKAGLGRLSRSLLAGYIAHDKPRGPEQHSERVGMRRIVTVLSELVGDLSGRRWN